MGKYIWIAVVVILAAVAYMLFKKNRKKNNDAALTVSDNPGEKETSLASVPETENEMVIKLEMLPSLTEIEENSLVEVTDSKVLARIDQGFRGLLSQAQRQRPQFKPTVRYYIRQSFPRGQS